MEPVYIRGIERILVVLVGGVSVYLGYRLFLSLPESTDSEGKFILPGNISIYMSRVGPGVFFALFGTGVVIASLYFSLNMGPQPTDRDKKDKLQDGGTYFSYLGGTGATLEENRANLRGDIYLLNNLLNMLRPDLDKEQLYDIKRAIPRIKLALMLTVWGDGKDWGSYEEFRKWIKNSNDGPLPTRFEKPYRFFNHGKR